MISQLMERSLIGNGNIVLGLIPGMIAQSKGCSFVLWWFYGIMIFIIALPHSLLISKDLKTLEKQQ